jgi:hypothetical protein
MVEQSLQQPANPDKRKEIKFTGQELIKAVEDRSQKSKTFAALEPANSPYKTLAEALASFKENRHKLIAFVENTKEDLRNHVSVLPIGTYDAYQFILFIFAYTKRHTQQIKEVKAAIDFPKRCKNFLINNRCIVWRDGAANWILKACKRYYSAGT